MNLCGTCGGDLLRCAHKQEFQFKDIQKGDTIRTKRNGLSIQGVAHREISGTLWETKEGALLVQNGTWDEIELINRPKFQEPQNIASIVWASMKGERSKLNWTRINRGPAHANPSWVSQSGRLAKWDELEVDSIRSTGTVL